MGTNDVNSRIGKKVSGPRFCLRPIEIRRILLTRLTVIGNQMSIDGYAMTMIDHVLGQSTLECLIELNFEDLHIVEFAQVMSDIIGTGDTL